MNGRFECRLRGMLVNSDNASAQSSFVLNIYVGSPGVFVEMRGLTGWIKAPLVLAGVSTYRPFHVHSCNSASSSPESRANSTRQRIWNWTSTTGSISMSTGTLNVARESLKIWLTWTTARKIWLLDRISVTAGSPIHRQLLLRSFVNFVTQGYKGTVGSSREFRHLMTKEV